MIGAGCQEQPEGKPARHRLSDTVIWLFGRASLRAHQLIQERLVDAGVRRSHYVVLSTLAEFGPAAQAVIGRRIGVDRSDMVALLNDLEQEGYVSRAADPADRRRNIVTLTPTGRTALRRFDRMARAADEALLEPLSAAERDQLIGLLKRVLEP